MNIQTVIANLLNTIEGKEKMLAEYERLICLAQMSDTATVEFLKINLEELNNTLNDCMAVREADIIKDLEIKDLKRQNSDYSWQVNPDRMGQ